MTNRHEKVMNYFLTCDEIKDLYFAFSKTENGDMQIIPMPETTIKEYVDGGKVKSYNFSFVAFKYKSMVPNSNENAKSVFDVEKVIEWIKKQDRIKNFPDFGDDYSVQEIKPLETIPNISAQDDTGAKYMFSASIVYYERG